MPKPAKTDAFQLKAEFLPITTLRLLQTDNDLLQKQLEQTIKKAPHFFSNAPVILDFTSAGESKDELNLKEICELLRDLKIQPIAVRGTKAQDILPVLPESIQKVPPPVNPPKENTVKKTALTITKPVRAGTQIYAKDSDLIILSNVNAGAEVIADGNIHVYGPLRGRALAGAQGDISARIFCKELEAELIAIAGRYWVNEKIKSLNVNQTFVQIFLEAGELKLEVI